MTVSRWSILRMRNVLNKICRKNQNTHFMFSDFFSENRAVCELMSENVVETGRLQMATWRRVACWISKATRAQAHVSVRSPTPTHPHPHTHAHTHTHKYIRLMLFHANIGFVNAPQYSVACLVRVFCDVMQYAVWSDGVTVSVCSLLCTKHGRHSHILGAGELDIYVRPCVRW